MKSIKGYKRISRDREKELSKIIIGNEDADEVDKAKTELIESNLLLAVSRALKKYKSYSPGHSLMDLVKDDYITFDNIWNIYPYDDGYVFTGTKEIFVYKNNEIHVISNPRWNTEIFQLNNKVYQRIEDVGLMYLDDKEWKLHPKGIFCLLFHRVVNTCLHQGK